MRGAKWFTLAATYVLNTWGAFTTGSPALVVLHSVPPSVVFVAAEAVTALRAALNDTAPRPPAPKPAPKPSATPKRTSFGVYLVTARDALGPDVAVTPAWVREVTGCSHGLSSRLAATLAEEVRS